MCGITGKFSLNQKINHVRNLIEFSLEKLINRGPDYLGIKEIMKFNGSLVLGHRRLSIIDLSKAGRQPMTFSGGELVVTFNGEIYNHIELREDLRNLGYEFQSSSDTEVLLVAWKHWGENVFQN